MCCIEHVFCCFDNIVPNADVSECLFSRYSWFLQLSFFLCYEISCTMVSVILCVNQWTLGLKLRMMVLIIGVSAAVVGSNAAAASAFDAHHTYLGGLQQVSQADFVKLKSAYV